MNKNILYLSLVQIFKFVIPIITFPYLTRVLGVESFGYLAFATALLSYSMIVCQYGFDLNATSKIARIKDNNFKMDVYCSGIYSSKLVLFFISLTICFLFLFLYDDLMLTKLSLCMLPMALGTLLLPTWLFQGLEMMKELVFITLISRLLIIPFVFIYINSSQDLFLAGFLQALPFFISGVLSVIYIKNKNVFYFSLSKYKYVLVILKSGWDVFLTSLASSVYLTLIPIVIGVFHGPISVGYFNVADTIKKICISFFTPIYQSVFPKVNSLIVNDKPKASEIVKRYFYISSILALLGTAFVAFYVIEIIILVSGSEFIPARETVLIMMVVVIVSVANNFFGIQSLIPTKNEKVLRKIVVAGATLCLIMMGPVIYYFDYIGSAFLVLSVEAFVFVLLGLYHFRFNVGMIFDWGVKP